MRLQVFSDLHLEFGPFEPPIKNPDVVVLAGDIHQGTEGVKWARNICPDCPVIYVLGNHEFYNHSIPELIPTLKREAKGSNVHVLENNAFTIDDHVFLGCSLWTNFQLWPDARAAMSFANREMSDFGLIKKREGNELFDAEDSAKIHAASVRWLERQISRHDPATDNCSDPSCAEFPVHSAAERRQNVERRVCLGFGFFDTRQQYSTLDSRPYALQCGL